MGIIYSGGTYIYRQIAADTHSLIIDNLATAMQDAGWSKTAVAAYTILTMTGQPSDGQALDITVQGVSLYAKNTPSAPNHFQIGATYLDTAANLTALINSYVANISASHNGSGVITITWDTPGTSGNAGAISESFSNATLSANEFRFGGFTMVSARMTNGNQMKIYVDYRGSNLCALVADSPAGGVVDNVEYLVPLAGRVLEVSCSRYRVKVFMLGDDGDDGTSYFASLVSVNSTSVPAVIASIADNGSGLIRITLTAAQTWATADSVYIDGATINGLYSAALNGLWTVTKISTTIFDLQGSVFPAGTYNTNSGVAGGPDQLSRCWFTCGSWDVLFAGQNNALRTNAGGAHRGVLVANQYSYLSSGAVTLSPVLVLREDGTRVDWYGLSNSRSVLEGEALIGWPFSGTAAAFKIMGSLLDSVFIMRTAPMDHVRLAYDGHDWVQIMGPLETKMSLWMVKT